MQGLGEIVKANAIAGGWQRPPHVRSETGRGPPRGVGKFGSVGKNGEGTPWLVKRVPQGPFQVLLASTGEVLAEYPKLRRARKHVADLIQDAP